MASNKKCRECGGCNVCCIQPEIRSLAKPAGVLCSRCEPGVGCREWSIRPVECRRFLCLWVTSTILPPELRPDRCGVMFEPVRGKSILMAQCDRPTAWKSRQAMRVIRAALEMGTAVIVVDGVERHLLLPEGQTADAVLADIAEVARQMELI